MPSFTQISMVGLEMDGCLHVTLPDRGDQTLLLCRVVFEKCMECTDQRSVVHKSKDE